MSPPEGSRLFADFEPSSTARQSSIRPVSGGGSRLFADFAPPQDEFEGSALTRGVYGGANALAQIFGGATSFAGDLFNIDSMQQWGADVAKKYGDYAAAHHGDTPSIEQIMSSDEKMSDFLSWAGYNIASGGVTALPALAAAGLAVVAGPAVAIGAGGALLYGMGVGDIYSGQLEDREDPDLRWAAAGAVPYAVAERMFGAGAVLARTLTGKQKKDIAQSFLRRLATEVPYSMGSEATAEGIQTVITEGIKRLEDGESVGSVLGDKDFWKQVGEGAAAGAIAGAPFGVAGAAAPPGAPMQAPPGPQTPGQEAPAAAQPPVEEAPLVEPAPPSALDDLPEVPIEQKLSESKARADEAIEAARQVVTPEAEPAQPSAPPTPPVEAEAVIPEVSPPAGPLTPEDHASPLPDDDIGRGRELIDQFVGDGEVNSQLQAAGFPSMGTAVEVQDPFLNLGEPVRGTISGFADVDGIPAVTITGEDGIFHYVDQGDAAQVKRVPTPPEAAQMADDERQLADFNAAGVEAQEAGLPDLVQEELARENARSYDELPRERRQSVVKAIRERSKAVVKQREDAETERQQIAQEAEKRQQEEAKQAEQDQSDFTAFADISAAAEEAGVSVSDALQQQGVANYDELPRESRKTVIDALKTQTKEAQDAERARVAEQKEAERVRVEEQIEADAQLVFRDQLQDTETGFSDLMDKAATTAARTDALKTMGLKADHDIEADKARRGTFKSLYTSALRREHTKRKAEAEAADRRAKEEAVKTEREAKEKAEREARETQERKTAEKKAERDARRRIVDALKAFSAQEREAPVEIKQEGGPALPEGFGAKNKVFTKDAADKAREVLRQKMKQLNSGLDPEIVQAGVQLTGYYIEGGFRSFAAYSKAMIDDLGEAVRPFLRSWYESARYYPGFDNTGMTDSAAIDRGETGEEGLAETETEAEAEEDAPPVEEPPPEDAPTETEEQAGGRLQDAGEKMAGKRAKVKEKLDVAEGTSGEKARALLETTSRPNLFPIKLPEGASPGVSAYLRAVRDKLPTFAEIYEPEWTDNNTLAAKRQAVIDEYDAHRDRVLTSASEYIVMMQDLDEAVAGSMNIDQAAAGLRKVLETEDGKLTATGRQIWAADDKAWGDQTPVYRLYRRGVWKSLPDRFKDAEEGPKKRRPIRRPAIEFGPEGPDRGEGKNWREGKDVTGDDLVKTFGLRGVEYGEWVTAAERQNLTNWTFDAFHDLAEFLGIRPKDISLGGTLGLGLGSRGGGGRHAAHYEPDNKVINITKTKGDGSLAHEWGHALDFGLGELKGFRKTLAVNMPTQKQVHDLIVSALTGRIWVRNMKRGGGIANAKRMIQAGVWQIESWGIQKEREFAREAKALGEYWRRPEELFSRAFEGWIHDEQRHGSPFLVNDFAADGFISPANGFKGTPYPTGDDRTDFRAMFRELFRNIEWTDAGPRTDYDPYKAQMKAVDDYAEGLDLAEMKRILDEGGQIDADDGSDAGGGPAVEEGPTETGAVPEEAEGVSTGAGTGRNEGEGGTGASDGQGSGSGDGSQRGEGAASDDAGRDGDAETVTGPGPVRPALDYRIEAGDDIGGGSGSVKIERNIEAIRILKAIEVEAAAEGAEGIGVKARRRATAEEQAKLVLYTGWGGLAGAFTQRNQLAKLEEVMTPEELAQARRSTINAHYTTPEVINSMWSAVRHLGFTGGRVLEPAIGIGHFFGMMPQDMKEASTLFGGDRDGLSARIAMQLYQSANIRHQSYEDLTGPEGYFDMAISNVPFADIVPVDRKFNKAKLNLHDYFFAKSLRMVRPGGLVAFITSKGTMDKVGIKGRREIAKLGDFVGALRLPQDAFQQNAGTIVTTDIIFLRRKVEGEKPSWAQDWVETGTMALKWQHGYGDAVEMPINGYFVRNPMNMMGEMALRRGRYGNEPEAALISASEEPLGDRLARAVSTLPDKVVTERGAPLTDEGLQSRQDIEADLGDGIGLGWMHVKDGKVFKRGYASDTELSVNRDELAVIEKAGELRNIWHRLRNLQLADQDDEGITAARAELNTAYDAFTKAHGFLTPNLSGPSASPFWDDPSAPHLMALEKWDKKTKTATKTDIFTKDTMTRRRTSRADTAEDALAASIFDQGKVNLDYMASISGMSTQDLTAKLLGKIFRDPEAGWQAADAYLSGNVRIKLQQAETAATEDPSYTANVEALREVQPVDLESNQIKPQLGAAWIPNEVVQHFVEELAGLPEGVAKVEYRDVDGKWTLQPADADAKARWTSYRSSVESRSQWGTSRMPFFDLVVHALAGTYPVLKTKKVFDAEATLLARQKLESIRERFKAWIWEDEARTETMVRRYNDMFNATARRDFDGSHLTFPGLSPTFRPRPHQKNAIWRGLQSPASYFAHDVGVGKTFVFVGMAMEARRLGLARKPMLSVPKKLHEKTVVEVREMYPQAKVLGVTVSGGRDARLKAEAQIQTGDWDLIVVSHDTMERIGISARRQRDMIARQVQDLLAAIQDSQANDGNNRASTTTKALEKMAERMENKLKELTERIGKDPVMTFEDSGVDMLMLDEAHEFKNLQIFTSLGREVRGLPSEFSGRAFEAYLKSKWLREIGGRFVMGSGTPLSNSIVELFNIQRFMDEQTLHDLGVANFDSWAQTFVNVQEVMEYAPEGGYFRKVKKFKSFVNAADLMTMVLQNMDRMSAEDAGLERPSMEGGSPIKVAMEISEAQQVLHHELGERAKNIRANPQEALPDNMLVVSGEGEMGSIDMRLLGDQYGIEDGSKIPAVVENAKSIYDQTAAFKGTQIIFVDKNRSSKNKGFSLHEDLRERLIESGIPKSEVALISDADRSTDEGQAAAENELFQKVRDGDIRVLVATTRKGGTGVNVQTRVAAIHHVDVDWNFAGYEQRNGRGLRQGNLVESEWGWKLRVVNYVTERTVDAFKWGKVADKARLFAAMLKGDPSVREIEDLDDNSISASEMVAIAAGDPRIKQFIELQLEVAQLQILETGFQSEKARGKSQIRNLTAQVSSNAIVAEQTGEMLEKAKKADRIVIYGLGGAEDTVMELNPEKPDKKAQEAGETAWKTAVSAAMGQAGESKTLAQFRNEDASAIITLALTRKETNAGWSTDTNIQARDGEFTSRSAEPRTLPIARLADLIKRLENSQERLLTSNQEAEKRIASLKALENESFARAEELVEKQAKYEALKEEMASEDNPAAATSEDDTATFDDDGNERPTTGRREAAGSGRLEPIDTGRPPPAAPRERATPIRGPPDDGGTVPPQEPPAADEPTGPGPEKGQYPDLASDDAEAHVERVQFKDEETQAEWERALKGKAESPLLQRLADLIRHFGQMWVRTHRNLPRTPEFADAHAYLRRIRAAPSTATEDIVRYLHGMVKGLSRDDLELLTAKIITDDFRHDVAQGREIPFFRDYAEFHAEADRINATMKERPDLMALVHRRRRLVNRIKNQMVENGVLTRAQASNPMYFRHQVLEYAEQSNAFGGPNRVRKPIYFTRRGTKLTINARLTEVEAEWMFRALTDIETMRQIESVRKRYDQAKTVRQMIRNENADALDQMLADEFQEVTGQGASGYATINAWVRDQDERPELPLFDQFQEFRRQIAIGLDNIRRDKELTEDMLPPDIRADWKALTGRGGGQNPNILRAVSWIAQNYDGQAALGAATALKAMNMRQQLVKQLLADKFIESRDLEPAIKKLGMEGVRVWQPDTGNILFTAKTIPQKVLDHFTARMGENLGDMTENWTNEELGELLNSVKDQLVLGGPKAQMVLPTALADTLDDMGSGLQEGPLSEIYSRVVRLHKQWLLISPRAWARYNIQNLTGDLDGVVGGFGFKALKPKAYMGKAIRELWQVQVKREAPSAEYREAADRGVFDAGWSLNEVYEAEGLISDVMASTKTLADRNLRRVWRFFSRSTTFRENWLRYSVYLAAKDEIARVSKELGPNAEIPDIMTMVGYGAAKAKIVDATTDPLDRAALIARETVGDYGEISVAGDYLRRRIIWFWSWQEINFKRYARIAQNTVLTTKGFGRTKQLAALGARVGTKAGIHMSLWMAVRASMFMGAVYIWNNMFFREEEEELSREDRARLHLILGRDDKGEIIQVRLPGALSDFLNMFGFDDVVQFLHEVQHGRGDVADVLQSVALAPVNRVVGGITPVIKAPAEAFSGKSFFPKFYEPRTIKDKWRHAFNTFRLEHEYDAILGRPTRGYLDSWQNTLIQRRDPGENAYQYIRSLGYDWLRDEKGRDFQSTAFDEKSRVRYYWRKAILYDDRKAITHYRKRMRELGVTPRSVKGSVDRMHPLGAIPKKDRRAFLSTLSAAERERMRAAVRWYGQLF